MQYYIELYLRTTTVGYKINNQQLSFQIILYL
jgi:hypothetical protein